MLFAAGGGLTAAVAEIVATPGNPLAAAVEETRALQPALVGVPGEHQLPALEVVDHFADDLLAHRGAAVAAADTAVVFDPGGVHIVGAVNHDGALPRLVVDARLQAVEAQGVAVFAAVGFGGLKQADTGLIAAFAVGKGGG